MVCTDFTPENLDYPELWTMARGESNNSTKASAARGILFEHLFVTVLLLSKSNTKLAQVAGAQKLAWCNGTENEPFQSYTLSRCPLVDRTGHPLEFDCMLDLDVLFDEEVPKVTSIAVNILGKETVQGAGDGNYVSSATLQNVLAQMKWE